MNTKTVLYITFTLSIVFSILSTMFNRNTELAISFLLMAALSMSHITMSDMKEEINKLKEQKKQNE